MLKFIEGPKNILQNDEGVLSKTVIFYGEDPSITEVGVKRLEDENNLQTTFQTWPQSYHGNLEN